MLAVALLASACQAEVAPRPLQAGTPSELGSPAPATTGDDGLPIAQGLRTPSAPTELGDGTISGVTPDRQHLFVLAPEPGSEELGCEGVPFDVLWSVDVQTGERVRAIDVPEAEHPFITSVQVNTEGVALLIGSCEGYLGDVLLGDTAPDGSITNVRPVEMPPVELRAWTMRWMPDGGDIVATGPGEISPDGDFGPSSVYLIDPVTGDWVDIAVGDYVDWIPLPGGSAVEITDQDDDYGSTLTLLGPSGATLTSFTADDFVASVDGLPGLAFRYGFEGEPGETSLVLGGGTREVLATEGGFGGSFSPMLDLVAWSISDPDTFDLVTTIRELATGRELLVDDVWFAGIHWVDNGFAYVAEGPDSGTGFGEPTVRVRFWQD